MLRKLLPLLVIGVWGITVVSMPLEASATTPLTRAEIQKIRNLVQLTPKNRQQRPARPSDAMFPGDGVSTGRASLAELRFNDRSLARVGEQAVFQFLPRTRNFKLSNGTVFLLIPPKQGRTRIQTPNAAAAIRGSALFVRYDEQTDTTIVGALTNSGIEVSNKDASQSRVLEAGQMLVLVKDRIQGLYDFDLRTFYETSDLVRGLDLTRKTGEPSPDPAIAQVQEETVTALAAQKPIIGAGVIENPSFIKLTGSSPNSPSVAGNNIINNNSPIESLVNIGQVQSNNYKKKDNSSGSTSVTTPTKPESPTDPPVITPTKPESPTDPPVITPTKPESPTDPPVITPTKPESPTDPPVITPTKPESPTNPPVITPTKPESPTNPPVITPNPPVITPNPPVITPNPPVITPNPPVITPNPPVITPNPPVITPNPPVITPNPPVITPNPPVITPNPPVITPNPPVITPNPPVITPNPPVITPNPPVITPNPPVITPNPPVITPNPPVITPNPPVITPNPPVITPNPPVITPNPPVITPNPPVIESPPNPPTTPNPPVKPST